MAVEKGLGVAVSDRLEGESRNEGMDDPGHDLGRPTRGRLSVAMHVRLSGALRPLLVDREGDDVDEIDRTQAQYLDKDARA